MTRHLTHPKPSVLLPMALVFFTLTTTLLTGCSGSGGSSSSSSSETSSNTVVNFTSTSKNWVGWCKKVSAAFTNSNGSSVSLSTASTFSITENSASVYSDSSCSTATTSISLSAGASGFDVYIKPTAISVSMGFSINSSTLGQHSFSGGSTRPTASDSVLGQSSTSGGNANALGVSAGGLSDPRRTFITGSKILVADRGNHRVVIYNSLSATVPTAVLGQPDLGTTTDNSPPTNGLFSDPVSVWSDGTRIVVTSRAHNRVMIWNNFPTGDGVAPDVILGQTNSTNTGSGAGLSQMSNPEHAFISGTKLIVVDGGNSRVLIFNSVPGATGASADVTIGIGSGNGPDSFSFPTFATVLSGSLVVADSGNNRIQIFNSIPTASGASADVSLTMSNSSANPTSIASLGTKLLVYDENLSRVVFWNKVPSASTTPDGVIGQTDLNSSDTTIDNLILGRGFGLTVSDDQIWVTDSERNRVMKFISPGS